MKHLGEDPGAGGAARGAHQDAIGKAHRSIKPRRSSEAVTARVLPDGEAVTVCGREAQTLRLLIRVGDRGFTAGEASSLGWARRTSAYIRNLRRAGFPITTRRETTHDGSCIGRYALAAPVAVVQTDEVAA